MITLLNVDIIVPHMAEYVVVKPTNTLEMKLFIGHITNYKTFVLLHQVHSLKNLVVFVFVQSA